MNMEGLCVVCVFGGNVWEGCMVEIEQSHVIMWYWISSGFFCIQICNVIIYIYIYITVDICLF